VVEPVHLLQKIAIEECRFDIHVVHFPTLLCCKCDEHAHRVESSDRGEYFVEVDAGALDISLCNKASLVLDDVTSTVLLQFEDPLEPDGAMTWWQTCEFPGAILLDGGHLIQHGSTPCWVWFSFGEGGRFFTHHQKELLSGLGDNVVDGAEPA
jgi:hypothetical protein